MFFYFRVRAWQTLWEHLDRDMGLHVDKNTSSWC